MKTKMTFAIFLLVGFLMTTAAVTSFLFFQKTLKQSISQQQAVLLDSLASQIDDRIYDFTVELDNLSRRLTPDILDHPEEAQRLLDTQQRQRAFFDNSLFLFLKSGKLVAATPQELNFIGKDFSFREYFKETLRRHANYISPPFHSVQRQSRPIIMFTVPIFGRDKEVVAVLGGSIDLREQHFLRSLAALKPGKEGFLSLYDSKRNVLMHPDKRRVLRQDPPGSNEMLDRALRGFQGTAETRTRTGLPVLRSVKRLKSTGWVLAVSYPLDQAYAALHTVRSYFVAGSLGAALLSLCIFWPFMSYLTRPLVSFTRHLEGLPAMGELAQRLAPVTSEDEIGQMARTFNRMLLEQERSVTDRLLAEEERRALERQLTQSQKMEAIGTLTGGIAHDFNNILTAIIGYSTMIQLQLGEEHPVQGKVSEILRASERASNLTRSLLAYSRKQVGNPVPVGVNAILGNLEVMLRHLIPEHIELRMQLTPEGLSVLADAGQIEQVMMNLAVNARDAMANGGILSIGTDPVMLDQEFVTAHGYGAPGSYALITVADSGIGMDEKIRDRIFEPFFTTKEPGKGTGLGLAMVYGIVKQHGGFINCYSELGQGTVFRIYLPLVDLPPGSETAPDDESVRGGSETLLLVEDDAVIREMVRELLQDFGYRVITAVDGVDAVEKFREAAGGVQLVILDVIMPRMNGRDAHQAIAGISHGVKALFMSGYTADIITDTLTRGDARHFVSKPIKINELLAKVRELLDE